MKSLKQKLAKRFTRVKETPSLNRKRVLLFVIGFAAIGGIIIIASKAATPSASIEPEDASGNAVIGSDSNASGGNYVKFGAVSSSNNAASRIYMYIGSGECIGMSDAQMDTWKSRGITGFVCTESYLYGSGGDQDWTGDTSNPLTAARYAYQTYYKGGNFISRAHAKGFKVVHGVYIGQYNPANVPFKDLFDDTGWTNTANNLKNFAAGSKLLGFDGLYFDQEHSGFNVSPGHTNAETQVKAKQRGKEFMTALLTGYPGADISTYSMIVPDSWDELVQVVVNKRVATSQDDIQSEFWNGATSINGYSYLRYNDAYFYKTAHLNNTAQRWDVSNAYNDNRTFAWASRHWDNWDYLKTRFMISPFIWIDEDVELEGQFTAAQPPSTVANTLAAFRKWGMGGEFWNFAFDPINPPDTNFNYAPYVPGLQAAAAAGNVDSTAPTLNITSPSNGSTAGATAAVSGNTVDNLAIHYVSWSNNRGGSGAADMTWQALSGNYSSAYVWQMNWTADIPLQAGSNVITITSVDIKGLQTTKTVTINR